MVKEQLGTLSSEISRVVQSPYPVCLKNLHDIVVKCDRLVLQQWADLHSPDIGALVSSLLEGLQLWSQAPELLRVFSKVLAIRDLIILQSPGLLDQFLITANGSSPGFRRVSGVCVALLSEPLPAQVPLPASAQLFLNKLAEAAILDPSIETLEPVYTVLDSAYSGLLDLLSASALQRLWEHFTEIIRTVKSYHQQLLTLYSLAILGIIHQHLNQGGTSYSSVSSSVSAHNLEEISAFFNGERAQKTMTLIAVQVLFACNHEKPAEHPALKHVTLSRKIAEFVDPQARQQWVKDQKNAPFIQKIFQKIQQEGLDTSVRLEAYAFVCLLPNTFQLKETAVIPYYDALIGMHDVSTPDRQLQEALSLALPHICPSFSASQWKELFRTILSHIQSAFEQPVSGLETYCTLCREIKKAAIDSPANRAAMIGAIVGTEVESLLQDSLSCQEHNNIQTQSAALVEAESTLCSLVLSIVLHEKGANSSFPLPLALGLVERQARLQTISGEPPPQKHLESKRISVIEQQSSQENPNLGSHWREGLTAELSRQAKLTYDSSVRLMARACEDLESRCESVEEPLRAEQARCQRVQHNLGSTEVKVEKLAKESQNLSNELSSLREQNAQAAEELSAASCHADEDLQRIEHLEQQLRQSEESMSQKLLETQQENEKRELGLRSTIARHVERLDSQDEEIVRLRQEAEDRNRDTLAEQKKADGCRESLLMSLKQVEDSLRNEERNGKQLSEEKDRAETQKFAFEQRLATLEADLEASRLHHHELTDAGEQLVQEYEHKLKEAEERHRRDSNEAKQEATARHTELEMSIRDAEETLSNAKRDHTKLVEIKDEEIREEKRKLQNLCKVCREKDAELEEAQKMRLKLLSTLGMASERPKLFQNPRRYSTRAFEDARTEDMVHDEEDFNDDLEPQHELQSSSGSSRSSSSKHGPTPKRPKPLQSTAFKIPTGRALALPAAETGPGSKQTRVGRQSHGQLPLQERSPNRKAAVGAARRARDRHTVQGGSSWSRCGENTDEFQDFSFGHLETQELDGSTVEL